MSLQATFLFGGENLLVKNIFFTFLEMQFFDNFWLLKVKAKLKTEEKNMLIQISSIKKCF